MHAEYIGKKATEQLIDRIEEGDVENISFNTKVVKTNLVLRNSTKTIPF